MSYQVAIALLTLAEWLCPRPALEQPPVKGATREARERRRSRVTPSTYTPSVLLSKPPRAVSNASISSPTSSASPSLSLPPPSLTVPVPSNDPSHPSTTRPTLPISRSRSESTNSHASIWTTTSRRSSNASLSGQFLPGAASGAAPLLSTSEPVPGSSLRTTNSPTSVASREMDDPWGSSDATGTFSVPEASVASAALGMKGAGVGRRIFSLPSKLKKKYVASGGQGGRGTESKELGGSTEDRLKHLLSKD